MSKQYRQPGGARITDLFTKRDGSDSTHKKGLQEQGKNLREQRRWRVRWVDLEGEQRTKSFVKKVDAQRFAEETNSAILRNEYVDPRLSLDPPIGVR